MPTKYQYVCSMWLRCEIVAGDNISAAAKAFDAIWPPKSAALWEAFLVEATDATDLVGQLGTLFVQNMWYDCGYPAGAVPEDPYNGGGWLIGPKGTHEIDQYVYYTLNGNRQRWRVNGADYHISVRACAEWLELKGPRIVKRSASAPGDGNADLRRDLARIFGDISRQLEDSAR